MYFASLRTGLSIGTAPGFRDAAKILDSVRNLSASLSAESRGLLRNAGVTRLQLHKGFPFNVPPTTGWQFSDYYDAASPSPEADAAIHFGRALVRDSGIEEHPFFLRAKTDRVSIQEWAKQECIVTNHFSMALFALLARIKNVHIRSLLVPVIAGEHSKLKNGVAFASHPHLLSKLVDDLAIDRTTLRPRPCTDKFIEILVGSDHSVCHGLGVLGVGNEALLIPEYEAVKGAFSCHYQSAVHEPFLAANINEDTVHSDLMEKAARCLIKDHQTADEYMQGAVQGVGARLRYYDELLDELSRQS